MGRMTYWNRKETGQVYTCLKNISTTEKQLKLPEEKKNPIGYITPTMGHYPMNG